MAPDCPGPQMNTLRLYVDGRGKGWAVVRCEICADINKYPALDALDTPIKCKCGTIMNVQDALMAEVTKHPDAPRALINAFSGDGFPRRFEA
jgi:hypothetical protein